MRRDKVPGFLLAATAISLLSMMIIPVEWTERNCALQVAFHRVVHDFLWGLLR